MIFGIYITLACSIVFSVIFTAIYHSIEGFTASAVLGTFDSLTVW